MFYDIFDSLCKEKGVKPTRACIEAGLSRGLASKWKSEKTAVPDTESLRKLSLYFGTSVDALLGTEDKKEQAPAMSEGLSDAVSMELLNMIRDASEEERRDMLDLLRIVQKRREKE